MNASLTLQATKTAVNQSSIPPTRSYHDKVDYDVSYVYKYIFGGIAVVSVFGNAILLLAIFRRPNLLSKTYNMLILSLSFTDMLTG